jgi:gliding motility-associated lipoprotein GldK
MVKKYLAFALLGFALSGCAGTFGTSNGELRGLSNRNSQKELPPSGMVLIPTGAFVMGLNGQDLFDLNNAPQRRVSIDAFWMDQTEITNDQYRQFVNEVRELKLRESLLNDPEFPEFKRNATEIKKSKGYVLAFASEELATQINWDTPLKGEKVAQKMRKEFMLPNPVDPSTCVLNPKKLTYKFQSIELKDYVDGARAKDIEIEVYPDTLVWVRDFKFAYNDPFALLYFSHPSYDNYPVVGVTFNQAQAFCDWRTKKLRKAYLENGHQDIHRFRLPTESEWEYAARGGLNQATYPWGGPYTYDKNGCYMANFYPQRNQYAIDGGLRTLPVGSYAPNGYGLYDMAGNVSEWTSDSYEINPGILNTSMNPNIRENMYKVPRKVIRGGSWKDIAYFLQCGARSYENMDTAKSYIGFRCVRNYIGK